MLSTRWRCTTLVLSRCRLESKLKRTKKKGERKKKRVVPRLYIDVCQPTQKKKKNNNNKLRLPKKIEKRKKGRNWRVKTYTNSEKKNVIRDVLDEYKKKRKRKRTVAESG